MTQHYDQLTVSRMAGGGRNRGGGGKKDGYGFQYMTDQSEREIMWYKVCLFDSEEMRHDV